MHVKGRYQLLNDNLLDLTHLGYLHGTSIGTQDDAATPEVRDADKRRLSSRRNMLNTRLPPLHSARIRFDGPVDRISGMDFFNPGFHAGISDVRVSEGHRRAGETLASARVWHAVTPSTTTTTHYSFAMGSADRQAVDDMVESLKSVVAEDVFATEEIERIVSTIDELPAELMLRSDTTAVQGRRILQAIMDAERQQNAERAAQTSAS